MLHDNLISLSYKYKYWQVSYGQILSDPSIDALLVFYIYVFMYYPHNVQAKDYSQ